MRTTLYFFWQIADVAGWWKMRMNRNADDADERFANHAFWRTADVLTVSRKRRLVSHADKDR